MWRKTVIDLTSLLDVILIMLFFILANANAVVVEAQGQSGALTEENAALHAELERARGEAGAMTAVLGELAGKAQSLEDQLAGFTLLNEQCLVARVYVTGGEDERTVHVETDDSAKTFPLTWENASALRPALREELARIVKSRADPLAVFLLFRYDAASIYRADYELVSGVIAQLCGEYPALHYAQYDMTEADGYEAP